MCSMSYILVFGILGLSSYACGTLPDYVSEDANAVVHLNSRNCGNGKLDPGEECDCGPGVQKCREDPCCQTNCQLKLHSQCSDNNPCCENCKFKPRGAICHKAPHECSIPEYCTGDKGDCSATSNKRNGANCTGDFGKGICIYGACKSFNQPCHEAWKSSETEPVKELTKCSSGTICVNQSCVPIRDLVNGHGCPRGTHGEECSGHGQCTISYLCHCEPGWKGHDCSAKDDIISSKINEEKPGIVKGVGPEQRDSQSSLTLTLTFVSSVILISLIFVVMAFRYLPARTSKNDRAAHRAIYPPNQTESIEGETEGGPTQDVVS